MEQIDTFILFGGIGDQVMWLSLLPEFRRHHAKPVTVILPESTRCIAEMFAGRAFDSMSVTADTVDPALAHKKILPLPPNQMLAWHCYHGDPPFADYEDACIRNGVGVLDLLRVLLGLPSASPVSAPMVLPASAQRAAERFQQLGLPAGSTVLIAPMARSWNCGLDEQWWQEAAAYLRNQGLNVVTNTGNRGRAFDGGSEHPAVAALPGTCGVDIPLAEILPFVELCGYFLGTRSGLCDLLAQANARKAVVFPIQAIHAERTIFSKQLATFWSIKRAFGREDVYELLAPNNAPFDPHLLSEWLGVGRH